MSDIVAMNVAIRVRPPNERERDNNSGELLGILDEHILVFDPKVEAPPEYFHGKRLKPAPFAHRRNKDTRYVFDYIFDQYSTQKEVFEKCAQPVVEAVIDGFNGSVFAYGATGAGKTHTMLGTVQQPGVIYQTMVHLFKLMEDRSENTKFEIGVSYLEVYNEKIRDLFTPDKTRNLPLREDSVKGVVIAGLTCHAPKSVSELYEMLLIGNTNRTQHATDANAQSSRSHAVFQVHLRQRPRSAALLTPFSVSKLSLIDLAGSERASVTTNKGARRTEGANINRSLLALGSCINALAEKKKGVHIPYRDSNLTRILKDSLGGNCKTCMIAAVSPSRATYEDTHNTLNYALRAKSIRSQLAKNIVSIDAPIAKYRDIIDQLKKENAKLKEEVASASKVSFKATQEIDSQLVDKLSKSIGSVYSERARLRNSYLQLEAKEKHLKWKRFHQDQMRDYLQSFYGQNDSASHLIEKLDLQEASFAADEQLMAESKSKLESSLETNLQHLSVLKGDIAVCPPAEGKLLKEKMESKISRIQIDDYQYEASYLRNLCRKLKQQFDDSDLLSIALLKLCREMYEELAEKSLADVRLQNEWGDIESKLKKKIDIISGISTPSTFRSNHERVFTFSPNEDGDKENWRNCNFDYFLQFDSMCDPCPKTPGARKRSTITLKTPTHIQPVISEVASAVNSKTVEKKKIPFKFNQPYVVKTKQPRPVFLHPSSSVKCTPTNSISAPAKRSRLDFSAESLKVPINKALRLRLDAINSKTALRTPTVDRRRSIKRLSFTAKKSTTLTTMRAFRKKQIQPNA